MKKVYWKYRKIDNVWEGRLRGEKEANIVINGSHSISDMRESRASTFPDVKETIHYSIEGLNIEQAKELVEDLVNERNLEELKKRREKLEIFSKETVNLIQDTKKFLEELNQKKFNKEKFLELVTEDHSEKTLRFLKQRIRDREMLRESQEIALKVLLKLDYLGLSKEDLAKLMKVRLTTVQKICSGKTNLSLKILTKLQNILGISALGTFYEKNNKS